MPRAIHPPYTVYTTRVAGIDTELKITIREALHLALITNAIREDNYNKAMEWLDNQ